MEATITELETNMSFQTEIDNTPQVKQDFTTVFVDGKEVKRPDTTRINGLIKLKLLDTADAYILNFIQKWHDAKKRINIMLEADNRMFLIKYCSVRKLNLEEKTFSIFYNDFKEA